LTYVSRDLTDRAASVLRERGGTMRTRDILEAGVSPRTLYSMRDAGVLEQLSRGVYRLAEMPTHAQTDLVAVAARVPRAVVCLISALAFHDLTTQIPHDIHIAVERGSDAPEIDYPPIRVFWFGGKAYSEGIEEYLIDGVPVRVYGAEKTVADCFKFRNTIGLDVALEALRRYRARKQLNVEELLHYARVCRVERVMRPYLEALL
jgi:predicted transcriptional regulator of viral defense system